MKNAGASPVGRVPSAVMFNAALRNGMTMLQVVSTTKSLGRKLGDGDGDGDDDWTWGDDGGNVVALHFECGRLARWQLRRPDEAAT